jgi:putative membrane protein
MKRWTQAVLGVSLAVSVVACAGDNANDANTAARDSGAAVGTAGANADRDFIQDQLEDGQAEVNLGKIASERATHPQVKDFAQMMVREHQMAGEELRQAASAANVQLNAAAEPDNDHKDAEEELSKLTGGEFDRKYIDKMIDEHQEAVNELEKKQDAENVQVRQWATKTLPKVRQHLEQARQIQQTLEQAGNNPR